MVTQFHTLLHFVTLNHTISSPTASAAASTSIQGVSKSHLLSGFHCIYTYTQTIAAGPICVSVYTMVSIVTSALVLAPSKLDWALRHLTQVPDANKCPVSVGS